MRPLHAQIFYSSFEPSDRHPSTCFNDKDWAYHPL